MLLDIRHIDSNATALVDEIEEDGGDALARVLMLDSFALSDADLSSCTIIERKRYTSDESNNKRSISHRSET